MGIKDSKEALRFLAVFSNQLLAALEDGRISFADLGKFFAVLPTIKPAFEGVKNIGGEIADMDEAEKAELRRWFASEFSLPHERTEQLVEQGMFLFTDLVGYVNSIRAARVAG